MKTVSMNESEWGNDLDFSGTGITEGKHEIVQCLEIELGSALNEWFLDEEYGKDAEIFMNKPTADEIIVEVARVIANEERVQLVGEVQVEVETASRTAHVSFVVEEIATGDEMEMEVTLDGTN